MALGLASEIPRRSRAVLLNGVNWASSLEETKRDCCSASDIVLGGAGKTIEGRLGFLCIDPWCGRKLLDRVVTDLVVLRVHEPDQLRRYRYGNGTGSHVIA